jgi:hypothetical protein
MNKGERKNKAKIDINLFSKVRTKEAAYVLGILWADGHIRTQNNTTSINCVIDDIQEIIPIFLKTGGWRISKPIPKAFKGNPVKTQQKIFTSTWDLCDLLVKYGYNSKSFSSPENLLDAIPTDLKKYWFRGYLDGDGCIRLGKKYSVSVVFSGTYQQDWGFMSNLCGELGIKYNIDLVINDLGRYSHFIISRKFDVELLCDYIYDEYKNDKIGFSRKYKKYLDVKNYISIKSNKFWSKYDTRYLVDNYGILSSGEIGKRLNKNVMSIYNKTAQLRKSNILR